jgi:RNA polymerase sigma-54 factor
MKLTQTLKQKPTVSPQLVLANELLQFSSLELEQAIAQELAENPALEIQQVQRCSACGAELTGGLCEVCERVEARSEQTWRDARDVYDGDTGTSAGYAPVGEPDDPFSRLPSSTTLADHVLQQARLSLPAEDVAVARYLVGALDDRGFLARDVDELAADLGLEPEDVEEVLTIIQSLEPVGVAARNVRECLLIQLAELPDDSADRSVAERLILDQWDSLGRSSLKNLGRAVDASVDDVREALRLLRENCSPFPAHAGWAETREGGPDAGVVCPEPDVIIREREGTPGAYDIELPKAGTYRLRVSDAYSRALDDVASGSGGRETGGWERWQELCGRARLFVRSVEQRWETLHTLMRCLIDYQRDFLADGQRSLKPLTRAQLAEFMDVHESTVSRAVTGKYVELPDREVIPLETFFDSAAPVKHLIEEIVAHEETSLSDRAIAERLREHGHDIARRTVAKYRNALNILPASLRKRKKELGAT